MSSSLLTVPEIADRLRVRNETVRRYIKQGSLKAVSLPGGDYRVQEKDVEALLKSKTDLHNEKV